MNETVTLTVTISDLSDGTDPKLVREHIDRIIGDNLLDEYASATVALPRVVWKIGDRFDETRTVVDIQPESADEVSLDLSDGSVVVTCNPTPHVVISGNPVDGFAYYGPFEDSQTAIASAETITEADWWIAELKAVGA